MKKYIIFMAVLFAVMLVFGGAGVFAETPVTEGEAATGPHPQLIVDSHVFEAGEITPGSTVRHEFTIENKGAGNLIISDVRPGCGCAVADYDKVIAPGASGKVTMSVRIYREWAGEAVSKSAWVLTNDPQMPQTQLTIRGQVLPLGNDGGKPPLAAN